ncbi:PF20097 family protein [Traorella massiliensis]|nr:PF20097 family protein [Traorella massiliensis]
MMKCPYCGKEMQHGYIPTDTTPAQWIPDGKNKVY